MAVTYTDDEIAALIAERKLLLSMRQLPLKFRDKRGHREASIDVQRDSVGTFRIIIRISRFNPSDFSIILASPMQESRFFHLRRYDGMHEHTNLLESTRRNKDKFYDFHIHTATERYQESAFPHDGYAESTERYNDIDGAFNCLIEDANLHFAQYRFDIFANLWRRS